MNLDDNSGNDWRLNGCDWMNVCVWESGNGWMNVCVWRWESGWMNVEDENLVMAEWMFVFENVCVSQIKKYLLTIWSKKDVWEWSKKDWVGCFWCFFVLSQKNISNSSNTTWRSATKKLITYIFILVIVVVYLSILSILNVWLVWFFV